MKNVDNFSFMLYANGITYDFNTMVRFSGVARIFPVRWHCGGGGGADGALLCLYIHLSNVSPVWCTVHTGVIKSASVFLCLGGCPIVQ